MTDVDRGNAVTSRARAIDSLIKELAALADEAPTARKRASELLKLNPDFYDAYLTTGMTEYVIGSLPFFVRWFIKVENINGNKEQGIKTVEIVARKGHYLKPFAKILLAMAHLREKRPRAAEQILAELVNDYPENPLFRKELAQLSVKLQSGKPAAE